jgi:hypothetical protein
LAAINISQKRESHRDSFERLLKPRALVKNKVLNCGREAQSGHFLLSIEKRPLIINHPRQAGLETIQIITGEDGPPRGADQQHLHIDIIFQGQFLYKEIVVKNERYHPIGEGDSQRKDELQEVGQD